MKAEHNYIIDEDVLKALETTEKALKDMKPEDRLDYFEDTGRILGDIVKQCNHIVGVLSKDDIMVSMSQKHYAALFENLRDIALDMTDLNKTFAKKVPTITEELKLARHPKPNQLIS